MKNTKICPKCSGTDIIRIEGKAGAYGSGNNIQVGWSNLSAVLVHRYLCCECGYSEEWIEVYTNRCPHCERIRLTKGAYCSYCGKEIQ